MNTLHQSQKSETKPNHKSLHPRNRHKHGYNFPSLVKSYPPLAPHVKTNIHGNLAVEFADPQAVKALNTSLLKQYYNIIAWDIPESALCPPIPGRVDYIHYIAELLGIPESTIPESTIPESTISAETTINTEPATHLAKTQPNITLLDIGTGANGIYPLLACQIYGWHCVGSDINTQSLENLASIIANNPQLKGSFTLRTQHNKNHIFDGIIQTGEYFYISVCNPPFHASQDEALKSNQRKRNNLARNRDEQPATHSKNNTHSKSPTTPPTLNFGGLESELWCKGGERMFLKKLIKESHIFSTQCRWFTVLVSKTHNVNPAKKLIRKLGAIDIREIKMKQGNKITRILAWSFL